MIEVYRSARPQSSATRCKLTCKETISIKISLPPLLDVINDCERHVAHMQGRRVEVAVVGLSNYPLAVGMLCIRPVKVGDSSLD